MTPDQIREDWVNRARTARQLQAGGELLPAWSTGELLAVGLILNDLALLAWLEYTPDEALERMRHELHLPTAAAARVAFAQLRLRLDQEGDGRPWTAEELLILAEERMNAARGELGDARDFLVGADVAMTDQQRARQRRMLAGITDAKAIIDRAKSRN